MNTPPEEKKTVEIPKADPVEILLREIKTEQGIQGDRVQALVDNHADMVTRLDRLEEWRKTTSDRVRGVSQSDLEQASQLAQERAAREELATKVDGLVTVNARQLALVESLYSDAKRFAAHPVVKILAAAAWTAAIAWFARHGIEVPK